MKTEKIFYENEYLIFYFLPYVPFKECGKNSARLDAFYIASNEVYHYAKSQIPAFKENGIVAKIDNNKNYKNILARFASNFEIGNNTLLLHKEFGSRFAISCLNVSGNINESEFTDVEKEIIFCKNCDLCEKSCPTGAIEGGKIETARCLRQIMKTDFTKANGKLLQNFLFGCDLCQQVCPKNGSERINICCELGEKLKYSELEKSLEDPSKLKFLEKYVGKNYVKAKRLCRLIKNGMQNMN